MQLALTVVFVVVLLALGVMIAVAIPHLRQDVRVIAPEVKNFALDVGQGVTQGVGTAVSVVGRGVSQTVQGGKQVAETMSLRLGPETGILRQMRSPVATPAPGTAVIGPNPVEIPARGSVDTPRPQGEGSSATVPNDATAGASAR